ncbi:MAG: hypothetical protein QM736_02860 [Vicinamibacterales bacterium]
MPVGKLDAAKGEAIYKERCVSATDRKGKRVPWATRPGPAVETELVERRRRSGARLHARRHHPVHDAHTSIPVT